MQLRLEWGNRSNDSGAGTVGCRDEEQGLCSVYICQQAWAAVCWRELRCIRCCTAGRCCNRAYTLHCFKPRRSPPPPPPPPTSLPPSIHPSIRPTVPRATQPPQSQIPPPLQYVGRATTLLQPRPVPKQAGDEIWLLPRLRW